MKRTIALAYSGRPEEAIPLIQKVIRLNPFGSVAYFYFLSEAYRLAGRFDEAVQKARKAVEWEPKNQFTHLSLASACILAGREEEARAEAAEVLRINPKFSLDNYAKIVPYKDQSETDKVINALRKAGLK